MPWGLGGHPPPVAADVDNQRTAVAPRLRLNVNGVMNGFVPHKVLLPRVAISRLQVKRQKVNASFNKLTKSANAELVLVKMLDQLGVKSANVAAPMLGGCVSFPCWRRQLCRLGRLLVESGLGDVSSTAQAVGCLNGGEAGNKAMAKHLRAASRKGRPKGFDFCNYIRGKLKAYGFHYLAWRAQVRSEERE